MDFPKEEHRKYEDLPVIIRYSERKLFSPDYHWHESSEIIYVVEGSIVVLVNNEEISVSEGEMIFINGFSVHTNYSKNNKPSVIFVMLIPPVILSLLYHDNVKFNQLQNYYIWRSGNAGHNELKKYLDKIIEEYSSSGEGYKYYIMSYVYFILGIIIRFSGDQNQGSKNTNQRINLERFSPLMKFVEENYTSKILLKIAAGMVNLSPQHFCKTFKSSTNQTFMQFVNNYRIFKANALLVETGKTITEIADETGFNSIHYFNKVFTEIMGISPSKYRARSL